MSRPPDAGVQAPKLDGHKPIRFRAFDAYFLGRPKIDEVIVRVGNDPNAVVTTILAGAVDLTVGFALGQQGATVVRSELFPNISIGDAPIVHPNATR